jgi:NAD-dependent deacetylase
VKGPSSVFAVGTPGDAGVVMAGLTAGVREAARAIAEGGVVAFTGAGVSAEAGIPTFRDPGGLWETFAPESEGTWEGMLELAMTHPDRLADLLVRIRAAFLRARPSQAHRSLVEWERAGILSAVVTQNVDGLHQEAGSAVVVEIHGSLRRWRCGRCGRVEEVSRSQLVERFERMIGGLRSAFIPSLLALLPKCPTCGGPVRPDVVTFGEGVREFERARRYAQSCRTLVVIGTSGMVLPAAELPDVARTFGAHVIRIDRAADPVESDIHLEGKAARILGGLTRETWRRLEWSRRMAPEPPAPRRADG